MKTCARTGGSHVYRLWRYTSVMGTFLLIGLVLAVWALWRYVPQETLLRFSVGLLGFIAFGGVLGFAWDIYMAGGRLPFSW